jgi:NADH-quinone oxidoreductase subunit H
MAALFVTIYLGGWRGPGAVEYPILGLLYFAFKVFLVYFLFIWIRGTFPRIRIDQLLNFNWKFLVPLTLALILVVAVVVKLLPADINPWASAGILFLVNVILFLVAIEVVRRFARQRRADEEAPEITEEMTSESTDIQTMTSAAH